MNANQDLRQIKGEISRKKTFLDLTKGPREIKS